MQSVFQESLELGGSVRKAGSDEGEEEEAAEESNESESSIMPAAKRLMMAILSPLSPPISPAAILLAKRRATARQLAPAPIASCLPLRDKANNNNNNSGRVLSECSHHLSSDDNYCLFSSRR